MVVSPALQRGVAKPTVQPESRGDGAKIQPRSYFFPMQRTHSQFMPTINILRGLPKGLPGASRSRGRAEVFLHLTDI